MSEKICGPIVQSLTLTVLFQVKISVYKDGSEVAWVTFEKNPGDDSDGWFDPSRVIDSYPWDKFNFGRAQLGSSQKQEIKTGRTIGPYQKGQSIDN